MSACQFLETSEIMELALTALLFRSCLDCIDFGIIGAVGAILIGDECSQE